MVIGIKELILIVGLGFLALVVAGIVWLINAASRPSRRARTVAELLAQLESLRKAEQITAAEYEKQRAAIVSSI